jgi:hypothetical protein
LRWRRSRGVHPQCITSCLAAAFAATAQARAGEIREGHAPFFALFLLAEFRAREALPAVLEAISLPGEAPEQLFGDAIGSLLARLLAILADDGPDALDGLIRDRNVYEYVRWTAARAYCHLVREGTLPLEEAVERLRQHLAAAIAGEDEVATPLVSVLEHMFPLGGQESTVLELIEEAFRRHLVEGFMIDLDDIRRATSRAEQERFAGLERTEVEDTVEELSTWAWFSEELPAPSPTPAPPRVAYVPRIVAESEELPPVGTIPVRSRAWGAMILAPAAAARSSRNAAERTSRLSLTHANPMIREGKPGIQVRLGHVASRAMAGRRLYRAGLAVPALGSMALEATLAIELRIGRSGLVWVVAAHARE